MNSNIEKRNQNLIEDVFGNLNLSELLKQDFRMDLPITGRTGNFIDNLIVLERTDIQ